MKRAKWFIENIRLTQQILRITACFVGTLEFCGQLSDKKFYYINISREGRHGHVGTFWVVSYFGRLDLYKTFPFHILHAWFDSWPLLLRSALLHVFLLSFPNLTKTYAKAFTVYSKYTNVNNFRMKIGKPTNKSHYLSFKCW